MMKIDVVDAHDLAAVDVNHLLIEQIGLSSTGLRNRRQRSNPPQPWRHECAMMAETAVNGSRRFPFGVLTISRDTRERSSCGASATSRTRPLAAPDASYRSSPTVHTARRWPSPREYPSAWVDAR